MTFRIGMLLAVVMLEGCQSRPCLPYYGSCESPSDCAGAAACERLDWEFGSGQICWRSCNDQLDCPREDGIEAGCLDVNRDGRFACYPTCGRGCPAGWVCQPTSRGSFCLP